MTRTNMEVSFMATENEATLNGILVQLRIANRLRAASLKESMKQVDIISILASVGASNQVIADVLGTTPATVANTLQRLRKKAAGQ